MAEPTDLIVGAVLVDNIIYADGTERENIPGGAGLYALAGAALFSRGALLVTGTGRDLPQTFGPWMERNGLSLGGLRFADDHAPRNILKYTNDGKRTETPVFGAAHFARIEPSPDDLARTIGGARSMFIFRNADPTFWDGVIPQIETHRPKVLWEIALDACSPRELPRIGEIARHIDALSINVEEATMIFGTADEETLLDALRTLEVPVVFLRAGARGCYVIEPGRAVFVSSVPVEPVDVTGGGNAFGGGALIGLADGRPALTAAAMGTVAARYAISQYGPPEPGDTAVRAAARSLLGDLLMHMEQHA